MNHKHGLKNFCYCTIHQHSPSCLSFLSSFCRHPCSNNETVFKIKMELVTQASIIVALVAFSWHLSFVCDLHTKPLCLGLHLLHDRYGSHRLFVQPLSCLLPPCWLPDLGCLPNDEVVVAMAFPSTAVLLPPKKSLLCSKFSRYSLSSRIFRPKWLILRRPVHRTAHRPQIGDFVASHALFIHPGNVIVYHECHDAIAFQNVFPSSVNTGYHIISLLAFPEDLNAKGKTICP